MVEGHYSNAGWLSSGMRVEYRPFYGNFRSKPPPQVIELLVAELG
jgi:hypothetical protein